MSSQSQSYNSCNDFCHCNKRARVRTAYTLKNYGRRFMGCADYTSNGSSGCNFFMWVDGVFNSQAEHTIAKLVKQKKELEAINLKIEEKMKEKDEELLRIIKSHRITMFVVVIFFVVIAVMSEMRH